jgi:hypothetical protein
MSEWNSVISVIGTLSGTTIGLLAGYWASSRIEERKEKHEREMYYRNKLTEHMDDIIIPLYGFVEDLWRSLGVLRKCMLEKNLNDEEIVKDMLITIPKVQSNLREFYSSKEKYIDIFLPSMLSPWVLYPIEKTINTIIVQIRMGKEPIAEVTQVINALMKYQENLKKLIGYETEVELEDIYPFDSKK